MNASDPVDVAEIAKSKEISHNIGLNEKVPVVDELTIDNAPLRDASIEGDSQILPRRNWPLCAVLPAPYQWLHTALPLWNCASVSRTTVLLLFVCNINLREREDRWLTWISCQFHSATYARWIHHRCPRSRCLQLEQ